MGQRAAGGAFTAGSRKRGLPRARRPLVFTSAGVSFCGSWMKASTADSRPRASIASASRLTWTANNSPSRTDFSGTFSVTLWASSATACDSAPEIVDVVVDGEVSVVPQRPS